MTEWESRMDSSMNLRWTMSSGLVVGMTSRRMSSCRLWISKCQRFVVAAQPDVHGSQRGPLAHVDAGVSAAAEPASNRKSRSMLRRRSRQAESTSLRHHQVRWGSPSQSDTSDDEFFNVCQSSSRRRSSSTESHTRRSVSRHSRDRRSTLSNATTVDKKTTELPTHVRSSQLVSGVSAGVGGDPGGNDSDGGKLRNGNKENPQRRSTSPN